MAELDLPQTIAKLWSKFPTVVNLTREEMSEASAFVEQWERGFVSLDAMPSAIRQDLISYLCSLINRTRQVGYREASVDLDGREIAEENPAKDDTLLKRFASAISGLSRKNDRS